MWRPPQRIKWPVQPGAWPTAEAAAASRLFSPLQVGPMRLEQRTWIPAMVPWRATEDGFVTQDVLDWYARFAEGQPGAIVIEATGIRDVPSGPLLRMNESRRGSCRPRDGGGENHCGDTSISSAEKPTRDEDRNSIGGGARRAGAGAGARVSSCTWRCISSTNADCATGAVTAAAAASPRWLLAGSPATAPSFVPL